MEIMRMNKDLERIEALKQFGNVNLYNNSEGKKYVSDYLQEEITTWVNNQNIIISAPTGSGKNYFIENFLLKHITSNRDMMIVTNRSALDFQIKSSFLRYEEKIESGDLKIVRCFGFLDINCRVFVVKYQNLEYEIKKLKSNHYNLGTIQYVIFDEAHFFIDDALFNPDTGEILEYALNVFRNATRIFMSATILDVIEPIVNTEMHIREKLDRQPNAIINHPYWSLKHKMKIYYVSPMKTNYKIQSFNNIDAIISSIKKSTSNEKWLIFINDKKTGHALQKRLTMFLSSAKVGYLDSGSKNTKLWKELVYNEKFDKRVLIATSVIDNGVNIKDEKLKHIVLPFCEESSFIQMLGRKRVDVGEHVNLYVPEVDAFTLAKLKRKSASSLGYIQQWAHKLDLDFSVEIPIDDVEYVHPEKTHGLMRRWWKSRNKTPARFFNIKYAHRKHNVLTLRLNRLAEYRLLFQLLFYKKIENYMEEDELSAFPRAAAEWLGVEYKPEYRLSSETSMDEIEEPNTIFINAISELPEVPLKSFLLFTETLIESYRQRGEFDKEKFDQLADSIIKVYIKLPRKIRWHMKVKNDGRNTKGDLNKIFKKFDIRFTIIKERNRWLAIPTLQSLSQDSIK